MLAQNIASKPAALPPAAPSSQAPNPAGGPSFAQFLTEQASPPAPPADAAPEAAAEPDAQPAAPANAAPARRATPATAKPTGQARASEATAKADPKTAAKADPSADTSAEAVAAEDEDAPDTPELKEFTQLLGMSPSPVPGQPDASATALPQGHRAAAHGKSDLAGDDSGPARGNARGPLEASGRTADTKDAPQPKASDRGAALADQRAASSDLLQAASARTHDKQDTQLAGAAPAAAVPSFAAALAQALPAMPSVADSPPPATPASLHAPLHSDAFAPELGARVSLLAVDGVQQAELQLNPADMGPVSVQIVVDGGQAQVSFHAAQAETRLALEQSLPDLAAALQGQGLTLSGGGVFQQAPRDADHGQQASDGTRVAGASRGGNARAGSTAGTTAAPLRRSVGLLDTFA